MILDVQIKFFWCRCKRRAAPHAHQSLHFQKIPGGLDINIFGENWHEASFYIKEQDKQKNWSFKNYNF